MATKKRTGFDSKTGAEVELNRHEEYLEKSLPSSEESERVILGAVLLDNFVIAQAAAVLLPEDFYSPLNRRVYAAMLALRTAGKQIDPILIGEELKKEGSLDSIGGITTITNLTFGLPHFSNVDEYVKLVKDKSIARQIIRLNNALTAEILAEETDVGKLIADHSSTLIHLQENSSQLKSQSLVEVVGEVREIFDAWTQGNSNVSSLKTGIPEVDGYLKLKGLAKGELTLIGARPSTGKTALILQIATSVIRSGVPTLFISLEMLKTKLVMRMLPSISGVPNKAINPYTFKQQPEEAQRLVKALDDIQDLPMYFDRSSDLPKLLATAEYFIQTKGVELIVFDYLTLIKAGVISKRQDTRDAEVGMVANEMKELAIRTNTAVLGAAQMNRESEKDGGKPRMSGFRESGMIEQAVDVALFPYDPDRKENDKNPDAVRDFLELQLYCDKQRDGSRYWSVPLLFNKNQQMLLSPQMREEIGTGLAYKMIGGERVYDKPVAPGPAATPIMDDPERDPDGPDF